MRTHTLSTLVRAVPVALILLGPSLATAQGIKVYVDGDMVRFDGQGPRMMSDRVVVPLRGVFERLGADVDWNNGDQSITCHKGGKTVWLQIGSTDATVDGTNVHLDQPAILYRGTTMVPLRFVSESLGADVGWNETMQAVNISTAMANNGDRRNNGRDWNDRQHSGDRDGRKNDHRDNDNRRDSGFKQVSLDTGTVIPLRLDTDLSSAESREGDKFTATVDTKGQNDYAGIPRGSTVMGHVSMVKQKTEKDPGVLALDYDALVTPGGDRIPIMGSMIALDSKSVETRDNVIVAKQSRPDNKHQSVWIGAGAGAVLAVITKGNIVTDTVIGAALGYLYETLGLNKSKPQEATLDRGTTLGVKLDRDLVARIGS